MLRSSWFLVSSNPVDSRYCIKHIGKLDWIRLLGGWNWPLCTHSLHVPRWEKLDSYPRSSTPWTHPCGTRNRLFLHDWRNQSNSFKWRSCEVPWWRELDYHLGPIFSSTHPIVHCLHINFHWRTVFVCCNSINRIFDGILLCQSARRFADTSNWFEESRITIYPCIHHPSQYYCYISRDLD